MRISDHQIHKLCYMLLIASHLVWIHMLKNAAFDNLLFFSSFQLDFSELAMDLLIKSLSWNYFVWVTCLQMLHSTTHCKMRRNACMLALFQWKEKIIETSGEETSENLWAFVCTRFFKSQFINKAWWFHSNACYRLVLINRLYRMTFKSFATIL